MCLVVLAWNAHPRFRLVLAANRDEFHDRPAAPLAWWPDAPRVLGGRDLQGGGTWLAVTREGRFGVVTNHRHPGRVPPAQAPSRGELVTRYVRGTDRPAAHLAEAAARGERYAGFNLIVGDGDGAGYCSNGGAGPARALAAGLYALGNERLDAPDPKLERTRERLAGLLRGDAVAVESLLLLLADRDPAQASPSATRGLPVELERALSAPFVVDPRYGTRCSTVVLAGHDGTFLVHERRFDRAGESLGDAVERFTVQRGDWTAHEGAPHDGAPPA